MLAITALIVLAGIALVAYAIRDRPPKLTRYPLQGCESITTDVPLPPAGGCREMRVSGVACVTEMSALGECGPANPGLQNAEETMSAENLRKLRDLID